MAGVQEEPAHPAATDVGHVARGGRPQAGPELRLLRIAHAREQCQRSLDERLAAHRVQRHAVAVQLGRAGHPQPVAKARIHKLVLVIGQADLRRPGRVQHRQRGRITLGRIDVQPDADVTRQPCAEAAQRQHVGIGLGHFVLAMLVGQLHTLHLAAGHQQLLDAHAVAELHALLRRQGRQAGGEQVDVTGFVGRREGGTCQLVACRGQGRLDLDHAVGRDDLAHHPHLLHDPCRLQRLVEILLAGVEVHDPLREVVILDARLLTQRLQAGTAVGAQVDELEHVVAGALRRALAQELQAPAPLRRVGPQPEEQRCIFPPQPFQQLHGCRRIGPGFGVADRDLPTIAEARLAGSPPVAFQYRHLVACLVQIPGRGHAHDSGTHHDHPHVVSPWFLNGEFAAERQPTRSASA